MVLRSAERREREKADVRARIVEAARALFVAEGYDAVTHRKVADAIGYTAPAIFTYFPSKRDLLLAVCDEDFRALRAAFGRIARVGDPVERLRKIGRAYVAFGLANPNHYRLMFMTSLPDRDPAESGVERGNPDQDAYAFLRETVAEAIAAGRFRPEYRDPELLAQALWGSVHGVVSLHLAKGRDPWVAWRSAQRTADLVIDRLLDGLLRERG